MAVGPGSVFPLRPVAGVRLGTARAGIRKPGRRDVVVLELAPGTRVAGRFTRNAFRAAPVLLAMEHLEACRGEARYFLVNTGNANAGTGEAGLVHARQSCAELARLGGVSPEAVLPFSTGVIGEPLPVERLLAALPEALGKLDADGWELAAEGIMTTDTRPKGASRRIELDGVPVTISGITKGAGMIRPDIATMLGYIATDARISDLLLDHALGRALVGSFNAVTVDGDTSTNDACVLAATGLAGNAELQFPDDPRFALFEEALGSLCIELAQALVRDAEGATKFVAVVAEGGREIGECRRVAYAVAESPLFKTALFASDPNWGRILAATGRAGVESLDVSRVAVTLNGVAIATGGACDPGYTEEAGQRAMSAEEIEIRISLGRGNATATVWTSDLSHDYVRINAEYRS
ncbi:MAG: bifunctional glutamate N-acetyltransferase/amino-acid acetyltransferase ArgJ [Gammaproteobacteria bacterium]